MESGTAKRKRNICCIAEVLDTQNMTFQHGESLVNHCQCLKQIFHKKVHINMTDNLPNWLHRISFEMNTMMPEVTTKKKSLFNANVFVQI